MREVDHSPAAPPSGAAGGADEVPRTILHVDLDAFFAAVEVREHPALAGRPVVVGADPRGGRGRGVVAAASYEARAFGIHSAMPIGRAYRCCPTAVFLRPRMRLYATASACFMGILARFTDVIEPLSIDEAFLDVSASRALFGDGAAIARRIKDAVRHEQCLTASVGVAPSKFLAKLASDLGKPDGLLVVPPDGIAAFLRDVPVQRLWGAGPKSLAGFRHLGARTIGAVARLPLEQLREVFGDGLGRHFHALARGEDPRPVVADHRRKSIGRETTFAHDVDDRETVEQALRELVEQVARRLRQHGMTGRTLHLKLRSADFSTVTRQARLPTAADTGDALWPVARRLLAEADRTRQAIRLVGVAVSLAAAERQLSLFPAREDRQRRVARAVDQLADRFGAGAVKRGSARSRS